MTKVVLPRLNQTGANEWADVEANDVALREVVNGGIDNENIKAAAGITGSQMADGTVTSRQLKATSGLVQASGALSLTTSYQDVPGGLLEVTAAVASKLLVVATFQFSAGSTQGSLALDGAAESTRLALGSGFPAGMQVYSLTLGAGAHTIKLRAKKTEEVSREVIAAGTGFLYLMVAS